MGVKAMIRAADQMRAAARSWVPPVRAERTALTIGVTGWYLAKGCSQPGSQQARHRHMTQEQVYVVVRGRGQMLLGEEDLEVGEGTMVFVPPGTEHAIRNTGSGLLVYVSATSPPFTASIAGQTWQPGNPAAG